MTTRRLPPTGLLLVPTGPNADGSAPTLDDLRNRFVGNLQQQGVPEYQARLLWVLVEPSVQIVTAPAEGATNPTDRN